MCTLHVYARVHVICAPVSIYIRVGECVTDVYVHVYVYVHVHVHVHAHVNYTLLSEHGFHLYTYSTHT